MLTRCAVGAGSREGGVGVGRGGKGGTATKLHTDWRTNASDRVYGMLVVLASDKSETLGHHASAHQSHSHSLSRRRL